MSTVWDVAAPRAGCTAAVDPAAFCGRSLTFFRLLSLPLPTFLLPPDGGGGVGVDLPEGAGWVWMTGDGVIDR